MPKFFVAGNQINNNKITIIGNDVNHIKNVLRQKSGDKITICDTSKEQDYLCKIDKIEEKSIDCNIIQKSVELGAYDITPLQMKRCVVKLNEKDKLKKIQRWQKISEVAAKQCGRNIIPKINNIVNVKEVCNLCNEYDIVLIAYENEKENTLKKELKNLKKLDKEEIKVAVIIGPEGGIAPEEIEMFEENGAKIITLGNRILRTETVALSVLSIIMYELEK